MKKIVKRVIVSLVATSVVALTGIAASPQKNEEQKPEVLERAIRQKYSSGQDDGISVVVYKYENGDANPINPANHNFKKGDEIRIEFQSNFDGYVYFINIPPKGEKTIFYPDRKFQNNSNVIRARQRYILPRDTIFTFEDDQTGMEVIQVVLARQPVPFLEDAIKNSDGVIASTAEGAAAEFKEVSMSQGGFAVEKPVKVLPDKETAVLTRSVRLAPPKEKDKEGAVVTVPDKLKPGEVAVFEIRLRRI
jgi:hypothetical protein